MKQVKQQLSSETSEFSEYSDEGNPILSAAAFSSGELCSVSGVLSSHSDRQIYTIYSMYTTPPAITAYALS